MLFQNTRRIKPLRALNGLGKCLSKKHSRAGLACARRRQLFLPNYWVGQKSRRLETTVCAGDPWAGTNAYGWSKQILFYGQTRFFSAPAALPLDCTATGRAASDEPTVPPSRIRAATRRASISA